MTRTLSRHPDVALVAGADAELLEVIKALLMEEAHFHVITVSMAERVMPLIETTAPGMALLDLNLPGEGGWNILATLRQHPRFRTLPVVLMTAALEDGPRMASLNDPWLDLVLKPLNLDTILERMQRLEQHQL